MKKKKILSAIPTLIFALLFSINCFALLGTQDPENPDEGVSFAGTINEDAEALSVTEPEVLYNHGIKAEHAEIINKLIYFWNDYGLITILIVLVLIVVIAILVYLREKKKLKMVSKDIEE